MRHMEEKRKYILDTDIGGDCDDCGALAMLCRRAKEETIDLCGVTVCTSELSGAYTAYAILDWYGLADRVPVARTARDGYKNANYSIPVMEHWLKKHGEQADENKFGDALTLLRRLLADNRDVTLIFIGHQNNMEDLLRSEPDEISSLDGSALVKQSVREVVIMGGNFHNRHILEWNIRCDLPAAAYTAQHCPVPLVFCGFEAGEHVFSGASLADASEDNPVRLAYWYWAGGKQSRRESWDPVTVYYALEPDDPLWQISDDCAVRFEGENTVVLEGKGARYIRYADERKLEGILEDMIRE